VDAYIDAQGMFNIKAARVQVVNNDATQGLLPLTTSTALPIVENKAVLNASQTYVTATHNVKPDTGGAALNASFTTVYQFSLTADEELLIKVSIYSGPSVIFSRTIIGSKPQ
jgi:hypothetical protein